MNPEQIKKHMDEYGRSLHGNSPNAWRLAMKQEKRRISRPLPPFKRSGWTSTDIRNCAIAMLCGVFIVYLISLLATK